MTRSRVVAFTSAAISLGGMGITTWLDFITGSRRAVGLFELSATWIAISVMVVFGLRIVVQNPKASFGWAMLTAATVGGLVSIAKPYAFDVLVDHKFQGPSAGAAASLDASSWVLAFACLTAFLLLFPDGIPKGRAWRKVTWIGTVAFAGSWFVATFQPGTLDTPFAGLANPLALSFLGGAGQIGAGIVMLAMFLFMAVVVISVVGRFRDSKGDMRQQMLWITYGASLVPVTLLACVVGRTLWHTEAIVELVLPLILVMVPLSAGIAVLRLHLYDIGYLINKSVVYLMVSMVVGGVFGVAAFAAGAVLGGRSATAAAIATVLAVAAFEPARRRARDIVDTYFDSGRRDARTVVAEYLVALRDGQAAPEAVESVLRRSLNSPELRVCLWLPDRAYYVGVDGTVTDAVPRGVHESARIVRRGVEPIAIVLFDQVACPRRDVVSDVIEDASWALEVARLYVRLTLKSAEVEAAQAGVTLAGEEERRRIERDLHDGTQQRLVTLGLSLRHLQRSLPAGSEVLSPALDDAVDAVAESLIDLRRILNGRGPAQLENGLGPALERLAETLPLVLEIDVSTVRVAAMVETAAYYVVCESITNALRHARARTVVVRTFQVADYFTVEVSDDGIGGANYRSGGGLCGMDARVSSLGGSMILESAPGTGTRLRVSIPCAS